MRQQLIPANMDENIDNEKAADDTVSEHVSNLSF